VKSYENVTNLNNANSKTYYYNPSNENSFRIITLHELNTLRLQNISIHKSTFLTNTIRTFSYNNGNINSVLIHPSEDYLIVLLGCKRVCITRIETGELCGEINLDIIAYEIRLDPSGLYLGILTNEDISFNNVDDHRNNNQNYKNSKNSVISYGGNQTSFIKVSDNKSKGFETKSNLDNQRNFEGGKTSISDANMKSTIGVFEIGTGKFVFSIENVFRISNFKFSNDGK